MNVAVGQIWELNKSHINVSGVMGYKANHTDFDVEYIVVKKNPKDDNDRQMWACIMCFEAKGKIRCSEKFFILDEKDLIQITYKGTLGDLLEGLK